MDSLDGFSPFGQRRAESFRLRADGRGVAQTGDFLLQRRRQRLLHVPRVVDELAEGVDETLHEDAAFETDEKRVRLQRGLMQILKRGFQWTDVFRVFAQQG